MTKFIKKENRVNEIINPGVKSAHRSTSVQFLGAGHKFGSKFPSLGQSIEENTFHYKVHRLLMKIKVNRPVV